MKLAAPFQLHCEYEDVIDEYNINYDPKKYVKTDKLNQAANVEKDSQLLLDKLIAFVEQTPRRINISIPNSEIPISHLAIVNKMHDNIYVKLNIRQVHYIDELKEKGIKFFVDNSAPISNFCLLDEILKLGVTDIYIADDLCYCMEEVHDKCEELEVQIRLILNRIPSTTPFANQDIYSPIFSPRDYEVLDQYIDVAEFDCYYSEENDAYNWSLFNVLYKSWFIRHDWFNDLREINKDLQIFYPVRTIMPLFMERKTNCGRACAVSNSCHKCETVMELAEMLYDDGVYIKTEGKNEESE